MKTKPYIFLQEGFTDADYLISIDGDKLHREYLIDCLWGWSRELSYIKIEGDDIYTKIIEYECEDEHARYCKLGFKSYYTIRNGIYVEEQPINKYEDWDDLEFNYYDEKRHREKLIGKETKWFKDTTLTEPAKTYIMYHMLGKDKAKEYGEKAIKKLSTKSLMKYKDKLEKLYNKYGTRLIYEWPEMVDFDPSLISDAKMECIRNEEGYDYDSKRILGDIEEIKLIMEYGNVPECEQRTFEFKKDAIEFAESRENY